MCRDSATTRRTTVRSFICALLNTFWETKVWTSVEGRGARSASSLVFEWLWLEESEQSLEKMFFYGAMEFAVCIWSSLTAMATNIALSGVPKASFVFKVDLRVVAFGMLCGCEFLLSIVRMR